MIDIEIAFYLALALVSVGFIGGNYVIAYSYTAILNWFDRPKQEYFATDNKWVE